MDLVEALSDGFSVSTTPSRGSDPSVDALDTFLEAVEDSDSEPA